MKNKLISSAMRLLCLFLISHISYASAVDTELFGENSRWSIDASTRITHNTDKNTNSFMHVIGLDVHKVFSNKQHDIGTLTFQPYVVKLNNVKSAPFIFDDGDDTQLTWRIANFNYTGLAHGKFNIRVGHFEVPFGLEYQVDTNGTLRQLTTSDRGIKADWGVSVNGILPNLEYEIALTRGSGNDFDSTDDPHIFSGRIGTPSQKNFATGLSWFAGDVLGANGVTQRKKVGLDASYYHYQWQFMVELSAGETAGNDTTNAFTEAMWKNAREEIVTYIQVGYKSTKINDGLSDRINSTSYWVAGIEWLSNSGFDISAQYQNNLKDLLTIDVDPTLKIQLRYRL
ncbi:MAG: hypothetical protein QNK36_17920 [Colwellia sp.]|nr:hypothetical protein [Colwellia sp.]